MGRPMLQHLGLLQVVIGLANGTIGFFLKVVTPLVLSLVNVLPRAFLQV
jgi:hypothetical protein